jgi:hypothetical protein
VAAAWVAKEVVEPSGRDPGRERWREAVGRAARWYPDLSGISF